MSRRLSDRSSSSDVPHSDELRLEGLLGGERVADPVELGVDLRVVDDELP